MTPHGGAPTDAELVAASVRLGDRLRAAGWLMATAESCTGGMVGHIITQVPGSSDHYVGGIVSYSDAVKTQLLGVDAKLLERVGAVSSEVADAMATGALEHFGQAELAVSVTGIAGPDGGSDDKPVGLAYVAAARRGGTARIVRRVWHHDRDGNKRASTLLALELALDTAAG
jgi:nicotinamide-nucleotide amidase